MVERGTFEIGATCEASCRRNRHLAFHDWLTELPNRALFESRLQQALANRGKSTLIALLLIDLDRFKTINDLHGHQAGDSLLVALSDRLCANIRDGDTVARLGGDEFAVIFTGISVPSQALDLASRVLQSVAAPLTLASGRTICPDASIGLALAPLDAPDARSLFANADMALYAVKKRGRNGCLRYQPEMGRLSQMREEIQADISVAVERGELELSYQPRISLQTGEIAGLEALVRWRRGGRLVQPLQFIPVAEDTGHVLQIGEWIIRAACKTAATTAATAIDRRMVSVNVSRKQFLDPALVNTVSAAMQAHGVEPAMLELELAEGTLMADEELGLEMVRALRGLGVSIALDNFGTGHSSLTLLSRIGFDTIKLDRSLVQAEDVLTRQLTRNVIGLAHGLGARVAATGVETKEQLARLRNEGCDEAQGYYIARPAPLPDLQSKPEVLS